MRYSPSTKTQSSFAVEDERGGAAAGRAARRGAGGAASASFSSPGSHRRSMPMAIWLPRTTRNASCHSSNASGSRLSAARTPDEAVPDEERQRELAPRVGEPGQRDLGRDRRRARGPRCTWRADRAPVARAPRSMPERRRTRRSPRDRADEPLADRDLGADARSRRSRGSQTSRGAPRRLVGEEQHRVAEAEVPRRAPRARRRAACRGRRPG